MTGVDISTLTMKQYLTLSRENQAPGVVKPEIRGNVNFKIKSQFMRELREDTFSENKNEDAHNYIDWRDGWTDSSQELSIPGISLKNPLSKGIALYPRPLSSLKIFTTSSKKVMSHYTKPGSDDDESKNVTSTSDDEFKENSPRQTTTYYIELYVPSIPFPRRLEQHAEEALIHKTMESLKKIKSNRPFLKEIRQSDEYPKYMKDLVTNKPLTMENKDVKMNHRCSALLLNQLPPKEKDPGSFILPCSIERLNFNNALAYLGASIRIMPFSMYKRLEDDELMNISSDLLKYITNTCESCHFLAVDTDLFTYEVETQETHEEIAYKCCLTAQEAIGEKPILGKKNHAGGPRFAEKNNRIQE
nr:hypothetical protein [Tanacetum cinerariifolium]